ncbi:MAG: ABC transporter substrate-binding protein [Betaproteobacteria bacterium]
MRRVVVAAVVAAFLLGLVAAGEAASRTKVKLSETVRSVAYYPMYVAFTQGFFDQEGLEIDFSTAWGGDKCAAALFSGQVDLNLMGPEAAVYIYNQGASDYLVLFGELTAKDGQFLVSKEPQPNFKWTDVKGKTIIGMRPGSMPQLCDEAAVRNAGLDPKKDVKIITNITYTALAGAFASGMADYAALFEPQASMAEKEGFGYVVASIGEAVGPTAYTGFHARKSFIKAHPEIVQRFINAIYRGMLWCQNHTPEEIVKAIERFFPEADKDVLLRAIKRYIKIGGIQKNPIVTRESFTRLQDLVAAGGELSKRVPFEAMVDNRFAERAVATIKEP